MMNEKLLDLYRDLCSKAANLPLPLAERLGCPFLPFPRDHWHQSVVRILVVGQEPFEWGFEAGLHYPWKHPPLWSLSDALAYPKSVEALTCAYKTHMYEIPSPYRPSPFTMAFNQLMAFADRGGNGDVISTNIFRCVLRIVGQPKSRSPLNGTQQEINQILDWQRGCLPKEIHILDPTAVVFFTGPRYDKILCDEFNGAELVPVSDRPVRQLARVIHSSLPKRSFRTYHPSYLKRSKERWAWIEKIAAWTAGNETR